jgi:hypothetical protein
VYVSGPNLMLYSYPTLVKITGLKKRQNES